MEVSDQQGHFVRLDVRSRARMADTVAIVGGLGNVGPAGVVEFEP